MEFQEALRFLDKSVNREATAGRIHGLSLEAMRNLLAVMGDPQADLSAIHVTGTNGKGSVVAMAGALLTTNGLRVGEYSSPHVDTIRERLRLAGSLINEEEFGDLIGSIAEYVKTASKTPSYFELLTAAALLWFSNEAAATVVIEVGLLGRFDATNVVEADVAVVTNIGRDHTDGRGEWRRAVAEEKAGIITPGQPLVLGEAESDVRDLFVVEGADPVFVRGMDFGVERTELAVGGQIVDLWGPQGSHEGVYLSLHGRHQAENASVAVTAVETFLGASLDDEVIGEALAAFSPPGRLEVLARDPLVVADGAHNQDAVRQLVRTIPEAFSFDRSVVVLGVLGPHDPIELIDELLPFAPDLVVACTAPSKRAVPAENLQSMLLERGLDAEAVSDPVEAVSRAVTVSREEDLVLVTGTFYIVSRARKALSALSGLREMDPEVN